MYNIYFLVVSLHHQHHIYTLLIITIHCVLKPSFPVIFDPYLDIPHLAYNSYILNIYNALHTVTQLDSIHNISSSIPISDNYIPWHAVPPPTSV